MERAADFRESRFLRVNRRQQLARAVGLMSGLLLVVFMWILFNGMFAKRDALTESSDFSTLAVGQTELRRVNGKRVWATRLSEAQRQILAGFDETVIVQSSGCLATAAVCVISTDTGRAGVELRFVTGVPAALRADLPWGGGYVNPDTGTVYDLLGRAYTFQGEAKPLTVLVGQQGSD